MKTYITAALAALALGGSLVATTAAPASADGWRGGYGGYHGGWGGYHGGYRGPGWGGAAVAGVLGLGLGAAIASNNHYYYGPPPAYYAGPTYYGYYGGCHRAWRWDPYAGRYFLVRECY